MTLILVNAFIHDLFFVDHIMAPTSIKLKSQESCSHIFYIYIVVCVNKKKGKSSVKSGEYMHLKLMKCTLKSF